MIIAQADDAVISIYHSMREGIFMTRKHIVGIVMAAIAALTICLSASGALPPGVTEEDMKYIMPLSQVKAGMKGY